MKYLKRKKIYKGSNGKNTFNPETMEAHSYGYWKFFAVIKGKNVFNNYPYSVTTKKHQWEMRGLLESLNISIHLEVECHDGLNRFNEQALEPLYESLIKLELSKNKKDHWGKIESIKNQIKLARKLGAKFSVEKIKELKVYLKAKKENDLKDKRVNAARLRKLKSEKKLIMNSLDPIDFKTKELNSMAPITLN